MVIYKVTFSGITVSDRFTIFILINYIIYSLLNLRRYQQSIIKYKNRL